MIPGDWVVKVRQAFAPCKIFLRVTTALERKGQFKEQGGFFVNSSLAVPFHPEREKTSDLMISYKKSSFTSSDSLSDVFESNYA